MDTTNPQVLPAPPSLVKALIAGFDAVSNHIHLILFPTLLDLALWLGPRVRLSQLIQAMVDEMLAISKAQTPEMSEMVAASQEVWLFLAERFNLFSVLRTYPVGVPSLMVSRAPLEFPGGSPAVFEMPSLLASAGIWLALALAGLLVGTLYFTLVADAAISGSVDWGYSLRRWPKAFVQVALLAVFLVALLLGVTLPLSCLLSLFVVGGFGFGQFGVLLLSGVLAWIFLPLVFSAHGIFVNEQNMLASVKESVRLIRMTLPSTGLFLLILLVLSEGLNVLWRVPPETSWFSFVGVAGHAFIATALLAASFIYYHDAGIWLRRMLQQIKNSSLA